MSRIEKEASPIYRGVTQKSREGVYVGDVIYFHTEGKGTGAMQAIKLGNDIYFRARGLSDPTNHYRDIVHVEIVTGIDDKNRALTTGIGRDPNDYPGERARERPLEHAIAVRKDTLSGISVATADNKQFAGQSALAALALVDKMIGYSVTSCAIAASPTRPFFDSCTAHAPNMMCGELVVNAQMLAATKLKQPKFIIDARIPPGALKFQHGKKGFTLSRVGNVINGSLEGCPPIDSVDQTPPVPTRIVNSSNPKIIAETPQDQRSSSSSDRGVNLTSMFLQPMRNIFGIRNSKPEIDYFQDILTIEAKGTNSNELRIRMINEASATKLNQYLNGKQQQCLISIDIKQLNTLNNEVKRKLLKILEQQGSDCPKKFKEAVRPKSNPHRPS